MADSELKLFPPVGDFPPAYLPTVFSDGVLNVARSPANIKFYLTRTDPALDGSARYLTQPVAQVVMPIMSFMHTALFFEHELRTLVAKGLLNQKDVDAARAMAEEPILR